MRFSFTKRDSCVTNGTLILHFTRKIHLTIGTYKNLVFLDCINTILPEEELSAETDKDSEWHGFGIHNIRKIVQKYDGEFELSMEKNTASAHAALHKNL